MDFFIQYRGEFYALFTAVFWTVTAVAFEAASHRVGSLAVNIIRLFFAFALLLLFSFVARGRLLPTDATLHNWIWLSVSGFIGFVLGDLFLFKSYTLIGSRNAMLIMSLVPALAAFFGWMILGEVLNARSMIGMGVTLLGISMAIFNRPGGSRKFSLKLPVNGLLLAFAGALGQALGLVISKYGMQGYDSFASNQIRILAGMLGFSILVSWLRRWRKVLAAFGDRKGMAGISIGSFFGPFLGVSFSLLAVAHTQTGIASTIMSLVPIFILLPSVFFFGQRVTWLEAIGAVISVSGVSLFFVV